MRPGIVGRERQARVAKPFELRAEIPHGSVEILEGVPRIGHAERPRGRRHELTETLRALRGQRPRIEGAFRANELREEADEGRRIEAGRPGTGAAGMAQRYVPGEIGIGAGVLGAGDNALRGRGSLRLRLFVPL